MRLSSPLSIRRAFLALFFFASTCALSFVRASAGARPPQDGKLTSEDTYTVHGTVINSVTHAAIAHALVFSSDNRFARLTDDDGHFEFKIPRPPRPQFSGDGPGLPQQGIQTFVMASLNFMARKPGFFSNESVFWTDARADELSDIHISLTPEALIVGHINLPFTDGSDKIQVNVYRREVQNGHARWVPSGGATSRANGDFRFANLVEGDYKLFTQELLDNDPLTLDPRGPLFGYPPAYFPSVSDFETASVIHLQAGQTFSANLTPTRREYYPVRLRVLNSPPTNGMNVSVEPQGHPGPGYSLSYNANDNTIEGMLPNGNYTVEVTGYGDSGASGSATFSVNGAAARDITLSVAPNSFIGAQVHDERSKPENPPGFKLSNLVGSLRVRLTSDLAFRPNNEFWLRPSQNPEEETLQFGGVPPGNYRLRTGCPPWAYVAAVNSGGRDLLRLPLLVAPGAAVPPLEITVRDDGAELSGKLEDWPPSGQRTPPNFPVNPPTIVLFPLPDSPGPFCQAELNGEGEFSLPQVPPGDYRVLAFDRLPENLEYDNREAMQKYESKGVVVRLSAGQKERVRLPLTKGIE